MSKPLKSGMPAPKSGQAVIIGPRGGVSPTEITVVKGKPLPPTPKPRSTIKIVDPTKNKK